MIEDDNPFDEEVVSQTCWRDSSRFCGPDCVAYDEKCEEDPLWNPCLLLNLRRVQSKSLAKISSELQRLNDRGDKELEIQVNNEAFGEILSKKASAQEHMRKLEKKAEAQAYAEKLKELDPGPPKIG